MIIETMKFLSADNSGSKLLKCIKVQKSRTGTTSINNFVKVVLKAFTDRKKLKKRLIYNGIATVVKSYIYRKDGVTIRCGQNKSLLFTDSYKFLGTRSKGLILKELRNNEILIKNAPKIVKYHNIQI